MFRDFVIPSVLPREPWLYDEKMVSVCQIIVRINVLLWHYLSYDIYAQ